MRYIFLVEVDADSAEDAMDKRDAWRALSTPKPAPFSPSMAEKAKNAAGAVGRAASAVLRGQKTLVSNAEQTRRMAICEVCGFFTGKTCKKCGCHIRFKAKLQTEHCPIGKW